MPRLSQTRPGDGKCCCTCPRALVPSWATGRSLACLSSLILTPSASAIAVLKITGHAGLELRVALLTAAFAILTGMVAALSPILCALVHHLPEIMRARSESRSMEWITKAALCGTCKTPSEAERKRADARAFAAQLRLRSPA
jgi:hypothetical protein